MLYNFKCISKCQNGKKKFVYGFAGSTTPSLLVGPLYSGLDSYTTGSGKWLIEGSFNMMASFHLDWDGVVAKDKAFSVPSVVLMKFFSYI